MSMYLGIDTSNYTTSVCLYDSADCSVIAKRRLLPVREGELGLRQSDAVFHHVQQLPGLVHDAFADYRGEIRAVGVSERPRAVEGSYMPCFTVGVTVARVLSDTMHIPLYGFSHQQGHIAAALYSIDRLDLLEKPHIAFHVSGGTTEALGVNMDEGFLSTRLIGRTLDLNAGQLIDRVGVMLGLHFPCGKELEQLALQCEEKVSPKITVKGFDCCLSGAENMAKKLLAEGKSPAVIARFAIEFVNRTIQKMSGAIREEYGSLPFVYAGGVMSDSIIRDSLTSADDCLFALPEYSCDNAAGIAVLASVMDTASA